MEKISRFDLGEMQDYIERIPKEIYPKEVNL